MLYIIKVVNCDRVQLKLSRAYELWKCWVKKKKPKLRLHSTNCLCGVLREAGDSQAMEIIERIKAFRLDTENNYKPPWETLNQPSVILFLKYYALGVLLALALALLYSTYGNYFAVCRDTPRPKSAQFGLRSERSEQERTGRHFHHRRYNGYTMQRDLDMSVELETVSP